MLDGCLAMILADPSSATIDAIRNAPPPPPPPPTAADLAEQARIEAKLNRWSRQEVSDA